MYSQLDGFHQNKVFSVNFHIMLNLYSRIDICSTNILNIDYPESVFPKKLRVFSFKLVPVTQQWAQSYCKTLCN